MTYATLEELKDNYQEGFRCIHTEISNDCYVMQLKNFSTEKIKLLTTANPYEISKIKRYLECLEHVKATTGHDC